jgi:hypothetical protein
MGITKEGTSMSDENKNKAGLPGKKVKGLFFLRHKVDNVVRDMLYEKVSEGVLHGNHIINNLR